MTYATQHGFVYIPKKHTFAYKVKIDKNGTIDDITDYVLKLNYSLSTREIGQCVFELDNNTGLLSDKYSLNDTVLIYYDFSDASTVVWRGYIERIDKADSEHGHILKIRARHLTSELLDITVTEQYENIEISDILKDIIESYLTGYTYSGVSTTGSNVSIKWSNKPFWDCVQDLCSLAGYDCYVDNDKDFHFFERGSHLCETEAVVEEDNLLELKGIGSTSTDVKNKIIVYGKDDEGIPIIHTSEDVDSQTNYRLKETVISNSDIDTEEFAKDIGDGELEIRKTPEERGSIKSFILKDLKPGDLLWVSAPSSKIHQKYLIYKFIHKIIEDTTVAIIEKERDVPDVFKERTEKELQLEEILNPNKLKFSYNFTFDDDANIESKSNTEIIDGSLKLITTTAPGTMITSNKTTDSDITEFELRVSGNDVASSSFFISVDGGITWKQVSKDELNTPESPGNLLKIKVMLTPDQSNPNPELKSLAVLYK